MIDFRTTVRKNRVLDPLQSDESKKVNSVLSSGSGNTNQDISDAARRMISSSPAAYVAIAFIFGGILGWLTSRK